MEASTMKLIINYPKIIIYEDQSYKNADLGLLPSLVIAEMLIITCDVKDGSELLILTQKSTSQPKYVSIIHAINNEITMTTSRR